MNLLKETTEIISRYKHTSEDVRWCGNSEKWFTWNEFKTQADFEYDSGFGGEEINLDLVIVGSNWWLERHEYDGSEWWEHKQLPKKPKIHEQLKDLKMHYSWEE